MISLASIEQAFTPALDPHPRNLPWDAVSRILDVADFNHSAVQADGTIAFFFRLRKPVAGKQAGRIVPLRELHEILFGKPLTCAATP